MNPAFIFEFIGTLILVLFCDGVCAACSLNKSKAKGGGWVVIALAWGLAVMMGVLVAGPVSGAHLNPAVTLGLAIAGKFAWDMVLGYILFQMLGGFVGALLVFVILAIGSNFDMVGPLPVTCLIMALGMSLGGTTGYAMNPARDLSPRCAHAILPIAGKRDSGWSYSWVPVVGPMLGGSLAAGLFLLLF